MQVSEFDGIVNHFHDKEKEIMGQKNIDYSNDEDKFLNFKQRAELLGIDPKEVCINDLTKHIQSIILSVKEGNIDWSWQKDNGGEGFKQRIADARNYLIILAGMIEEEHK